MYLISNLYDNFNILKQTNKETNTEGFAAFSEVENLTS